MLISYRWLARHVDLSGLSPQDVVDSYTMHTAEVEGLEPFAPHLSKVVVGHVVACEKHADADRLSVCYVDLGDGGEPEQIVCGAPNVDTGQNVAVARVGTVLPGGLKLKKAKVRGVESRGMICSERELDLGDEHSGIWVLPAQAKVGLPVAEALDITDWVIEIENKSLTHRPDLWGHRGLASELAAIHGLELKALDFELPATGGGKPYPVRVETSGCMRYLGLAISGVQIERSPVWLQMLLLAVGQRPLDLLVDLSNFVMLDLAQPNHLFDLNSLSKDGICVRDARPDECMQTLDEVERVFTAQDMLICSGDRPVAVAGVMGGEGSKVASGTSDLLLEVASFHPTRVRRTASRLGLRTEASARFEKFLDPTLPAKAAAHLVHTLRAIQPDVTLPRALGDAGDWQDPACEVALRPARVRAVLGIEISDEEIESILERLGLGVTHGEPWRVSIPSARATKDLAIEEDLIEEVGRIHGYDAIPEQPLTGNLEPSTFDPRRALVRRIADRLSGPALFHESMTYTFQENALIEMLGEDERPHIRLENPQHEGSDCIRRSVLPSLLGHLAKNRRLQPNVRLFEIGKGYVPELANERGEPRELHQLALTRVTPRPEKQDRFDAGAFAELQGVLEDLWRHLGRSDFTWRQVREDVPSWAHPGRCVAAFFGEHRIPVCMLAGLEPEVQTKLGLTGELDSEVACAELSIDELLQIPEATARYQPLPRFPSVKVDVALSIPENLQATEIRAAIEKSGKGLVGSAELFDIYRGESLGANQKSLAYHVLLQADRTLTEKDTSKFLGRLERAVADLGGELRKQ